MTHLQTIAQIPDLGLRMIALVAVTFVLAVMGMLIYFKMKEKDEEGRR